MNPRTSIKTLAATTTASLALALPATASAACPDQHTQAYPAFISLSKFEDSVHCLVNEERTDQGLASLSHNGKLAEAARRHSTAMRWGHFFSHDSLDGSSFSDRIINQGYLFGATSWLVGENIVWGSFLLSTPRQLVTAWMNSPGHRKNILEPRFQEMGMGADWGTPSDPKLLPAAIVTNDFGYLAGGPETAGKKKKSKKKGKKKRAKRKRAKHARR